MTIEEKRNMLYRYCYEREGCTDCLLKGGDWERMNTIHYCLLIADSPESDLDKALKIISPSNIEPFDDPVKHPSHYTDGKIEVIDFIEDKKLGFCLGNAVKYIARAGKKNPDKEVEDLKKAAWYIDRRIKELEEAK